MMTNVQTKEQRLTFRAPVTLLGAGPVTPQYVKEFIKNAPRVVAADGGAEHALGIGLTPDYVIGDFDSLPQLVTDTLPADRMIRISDQDSTDFEKCLSRVEAPLIYALGFTGGRVDHELAVYNALVRYPSKLCIVVSTDDVILHAPPSLSIDLPIGERLSLFPMAKVTGRSQGLRWPIDEITFSPDGRVGTSNEVVGRVELEFVGSGMLLILPKHCLSALVDGVTG